MTPWASAIGKPQNAQAEPLEAPSAILPSSETDTIPGRKPEPSALAADHDGVPSQVQGVASAPPTTATLGAQPRPRGMPHSKFDLDMFSLPVSPMPSTALHGGADPSADSPIPVRTASELQMLLVEERRRARKPMLVITVGAVLLAAVAVALAVWNLSSENRSQAPEGSRSIATNTDQPRPRDTPRQPATGEEPPMTRTGPEQGDARDLGDLDIDVSAHNNDGSRRRRRSGSGSSRRRRTSKDTATSSGGEDPLALPTPRPRFSGISSLGDAPDHTQGGETSTSAGATPPNLRGLVNRNQGALKRCYEKAALLDSRLRSPRLSITVRVTSSGRVTSVRISPSRYEADTLGICVRRSIQSWAFPSFANDYSWTFSARFQGG